MYLDIDSLLHLSRQRSEDVERTRGGEGGYWPTGLLASHGRQEGDILPPTTRLHPVGSPSSFLRFSPPSDGLEVHPIFDQVTFPWFRVNRTNINEEFVLLKNHGGACGRFWGGLNVLWTRRGLYEGN